MSLADFLQKPSAHKKGLKVLVYGDTGTGKTVFALTFPKIVALDSEDGMGWYIGDSKKSDENLEYVLSTQSYDELEDLLDKLDLSTDEFETLVIDSETKIYENIQEALQTVEEERAMRKGRDILDTNISVRSWGKIKQLASRLQNAKVRLSSRGVNIVSFAHSADVMEDAGNGTRIKVGERPDMAKKAPFDYDVVLRLYKENDKFLGEVIKDRTGSTKPGEVIENPNYGVWKKRVEGKDNQGNTEVKDFNKDKDAAEKAYREEVDSNLSFVDRVKEYMTGLNKADQTAFVEKVVKATGIKKFNDMNKEQQEAVLALINN